jgi:hypothetical protein
MKVSGKNQVLVLSFVALFATILWTSGCAGVAEPLPSLSITPNALSVSAKVGTASSQMVSVTNIGTTDVGVTQAIVTGTGFSVSGLATPLTLSAGQTKSFTVKFSATTAGSVNGSLTVFTDAHHRPVLLSLHGSAATTSPNVASVAVTPVTATPAPGARVQFTAAVQGTTTNDAVMWTASMGTITTTGVYTAPPRASTGTVTATSVADPTKSASAVVTVAPVSTPTPTPSPTPTPNPTVTSVTVAPVTNSTTAGGTLSFTATVAGSTTNKAVTWHASSGSITSAGVFTAPSTAGTSVVTAASVADPGKSGSATVTVSAAPTAPVVTSVSISPASASATTGGALTFTATVQGTVTDKSVIWKAASGSINSSGAYTAPAKAGTDTVTATSNADRSKSASASVTVTAAAPPTPPPAPPTQSASCGGSGCPAFPGAEGGGAASVGGRGGVVIEVTNLSDSGTGSLRACIQASGPRTCVFRVSGVITSQGRLAVTNPYITIAGQTAPGGGIVIGGFNQGGEQLDVQTHDVVVRYLTYDGNSPRPTGPDTGTVGFEMANGGGDVYNVVFDHLSARWAGNKSTIVYANDDTGRQHIHDTSWQWILEYEPNNSHPVGPTITAIRDPHEDANNDWHHNVFINVGHRIPLNELDEWRWVSNITYNWDYFASNQSGSQSDFISNRWVPGPQTAGATDPHPVNATLGNGSGSGNCLSNCDTAGTPSIYMKGNSCQFGTDYQCSAEEAGNDPEGFPEVASPIRPNWQRDTPLPSEQFPITADSANSLDSVLLPTIGNSQHLDCSGNFVSMRDSQDARVIAQYVAKGPGGGFAGPNYQGASSSPAIAGGTLCQESLHDGLPDQWKTLKGLSTTDSNLYRTVAPNGYTYLENYLNGVN